ncbi:related to HNM1-Choline permease [Phialocephala subalpina]|uniref:Related to HNM1-Choline permease n=1 Tax=Phialocephala subalpina TaxID=576137 RepID=A0A1L7WXP2_9HELO|nr:related to HNM1-Choline permease [Phialocephala subalpina]
MARAALLEAWYGPMTFAILNTRIAFAGSIGIVIPSGGSVAFLYGFIFCVLCNRCIAVSLGELASVWPTAGGQYHYAYAWASEKWKKSISFWVGKASLVAYASQFVSAAAVVGSNGACEIKQWRTFLIFVAILIFTALSNLYGNKILAKWNDGTLYWSILAVVVISITIIATSDKNDTYFVFTDFRNETGWSDGTAWIMGLLQRALSLIGFDAACHMTEEMPSPSKDTPRAMIYAILVHSRTAAVVSAAMLAVCFINGTNGCVTSASRLLFAMARDKGMPFSGLFSVINPSSHVPSRDIGPCFVFNLLFGLLYLGPTVAFNAEGKRNLEREAKGFEFGLGRWGYVANYVGIVFVGVTSFFFCLPVALPTTSSTMNYVSAVLGILAILLLGIWLGYKKQYQGPEFGLILGGEALQQRRHEEVMVSEKRNGSEKISVSGE